MKRVLVSLICLVLCSHSFCQFIAKDSAGHYANFNEQGTRISPWKKFKAFEHSQKGKYFIVRKDIYYGVVDQYLNTVISPQFSSIHFDEKEDFIACQSSNKTIIYDNNLHPIFKDDNYCKVSFKESYIKITKAAKTGAIKYSGKPIIPIAYDDCFEYRNVLFTRDQNTFGAIHLDDFHLFPAEFEAFSLFNRNCIRFIRNDSAYYYKYDGTPLPYSDSIPTFLGSNLKIYHSGQGNLYDFKTLEKLVHHSYQDIFQLGYGEFKVTEKAKVGILDSSGQIIISPQYNNIITNAKVGKDMLYIVRDTSQNVGLINQKNEVIIPFQYSFIRKEQNYFMVFQNNKVGCYDAEGNLQISPDMDYFASHYNGYVFKTKGYFGFLSPALDTILDPIYTTLKANANSFRQLIYETPTTKAVIYNGTIVKQGVFHSYNFSQSWFKFYTKDSINHIYFTKNENGNITIDASITYKRPPKIDVNWKFKIKKYTTNFCKKYSTRDPVTGDLIVHSMIQNEKGTPIRLINGYKGGQYAFEPAQQYISLLDQKIKVFRNLYRYDLCSYSYFDKISATSRDDIASITGFKSTSFERVLDREGNFKYYSGFQSYPYIGDAHYQYICHVVAGKLNYNEGTNLVTFKTLFDRLQRYHTFEVNSNTIFTALSEDKMIKISNASWVINEIDNVHLKFKHFKDARDVQEFKNDFLIIENMDHSHEVRRSKITEKIISNMSTINLLQALNNHYFDCINNEGKRLLFDSNGKILLDRYSEIIFVSDYFIKYKIGQEEKILSLYKKLTF